MFLVMLNFMSISFFMLLVQMALLILLLWIFLFFKTCQKTIFWIPCHLNHLQSRLHLTYLAHARFALILMSRSTQLLIFPLPHQSYLQWLPLLLTMPMRQLSLTMMGLTIKCKPDPKLVFLNQEIFMNMNLMIFLLPCYLSLNPNAINLL